MTARRLCSLLAVVPLLASASLAAQGPQPRLSAPIADAARATLAGSQPPRARIARDVGAASDSLALPHITLFFSRSAAQQTDLESLLAAQQDPASAQYHQWLTPAEFGARFGLADADLAKTEAWLESKGLSVVDVAPSRNSITVSGTAAMAASAFGAPIHRYTLNGESHIAPASDLTLPAQLARIVTDVRGLSDFRPHPHVKYANGAAFRPNFTSAQTGNHFLTPGDVSVIYDIKAAYSAGYNGSGQTIAIMGQSAVNAADVTNFQTAIGQTAKAPNVILVPNTGTSAVYTGDESESDLDLEYATGIAPGATVDFVFVGSSNTADVFTSLTWAVQNRIAPILNISYGECEPLLGQASYNSTNQTLQQAAAQGQTVISAAGDDGSTDCYIGTSAGQGITLATEDQLAVDFPSSSQYVLGVGGTEFPSADVATGANSYFSGASGSDTLVSALSYIPEQAWNDDSATGAAQYGLSSGGGGVSIFTPAPSWQAGVPGIPSGASNRFVPDIALDASPNNAPYAYCTSDNTAWASGQTGSCNAGLRDSTSQDLTVAGGTSFAAPIFAGMLAVIHQAKGYTYQGIVTPTLYSLASNPATYATAFHDIAAGSNACNLGATYCGAGAGVTDYAAAAGYDEATGLGSVDLNNLLTAWPQNTTSTNSASFTLSASPLTITQPAGSSGTATATSNITVTPQNGYTGTISWVATTNATVDITTSPTATVTACYSLPNTSVSSNSPATATLTVTTISSGSCPSGLKVLRVPATQTGKLDKPSPSSHRSEVALAGFGIVSLGVIVLLPAGQRKRLPALLAILVLAGAGLGLSGCGGGSVATSGGTGGGGGGGNQNSTYNYTITVIGTDTSNSAITANTTLAFTLTVQ
jgi:subtilase family serine protease